MQKGILRNVLIVTATALVLSACATPGQYRSSVKYSDDCDNGGSDVVIAYRDSYLQVTPKTNLKKNAALKFIFKTKKGTSEDKNGSKDNAELEVTIKGMKFVPHPGAIGATEFTWLDTTGKAGRGRRSEKVVCVPEDQAPGTYFYSVEVEKVGILDPRADVAK